MMSRYSLCLYLRTCSCQYEYGMQHLTIALDLCRKSERFDVQHDSQGCQQSKAAVYVAYMELYAV